MKFNKKIVFFEDTDSVEQIKDFYKDLIKKEEMLENKEHGSASFKKTSLPLSKIIEQIENFKFTNLKQEEVIQIKLLLKKEQQGLNNDFQDLFNIKLTAGLSLIDYLTRNFQALPHEFKYKKEEICYVGDFVGVLKDELYEIQHISGSNPISFYIDLDKKKLPYLNFSQSFSKNVDIIKNNFISDMETEEFDSIVDDYLKFKNSLSNSKIKKSTI